MRRVLILTYYWPPSGGSGVQRWLKFVKYLRDFGWEPVVYTAEGGEAPAIDQSLLRDVPQGIQVLRTPIWEPYTLYKRVMGIPATTTISAGFTSEKESKGLKDKLGKWVRGNLFIPDARRFWIRPSVKYLRKWLSQNPVDAIVSTGPPHSMHLIAMRLKESTGLPWLADFRDPWTDIDFYKELHLTRFADGRHRKLEKAVLSAADEVVVISDGMAAQLGSKFEGTCKVITNGFDPDDLEELPAYDPAAGFVLLHAGTLGPDRNPPRFWEALAHACDEEPGLKDELRIRLIGKSDASAIASIRGNGLSGYLEQVQYMPHHDILSEMAKASALLLFINDSPNAAGILTGKVFEYLMCRRPVMATGPRGGDADRVLEASGAGRLFDFGDMEGMKRHLLSLYRKHKAGELDHVDAGGIDRYSRRSLSAAMAGALAGIVSARG